MSRTSATPRGPATPGDQPVSDDEREVEPLVETARDATDEPGPPVIEVDAERRV